MTRLDGRGAVTLDASFVNATEVLALDLSLQEDAGGIAATLLQLPGQPALALGINGTAPLNDYTADIRLASDGTPRLTGQVTIRDTATEGATAKAFRADLSGDLTPLFAAEYRPFFGPQSTLELTGTREQSGALEIANFALSAAQISVSGALSLDAAGWPQRFRLNWQMGDGDTRVRLPISGPATHVLGATIDAAFDAARGDRWRAQLGLTGFERPGIDLATATFSGRGALERTAPRGVTALMEFGVGGLRLDDPALAEAVGTELSG